MEFTQKQIHLLFEAVETALDCHTEERDDVFYAERRDLEKIRDKIWHMAQQSQNKQTR